MTDFRPMNERKFCDIHDFCQEARDSGITTVILCYTDEWGPSALPDHAVCCGPRQEMLLLAYRDGAVWRCELSGEAAARATVQEQVSDYGLRWQERSRNDAGYGKR